MFFGRVGDRDGEVSGIEVKWISSYNTMHLEILIMRKPGLQSLSVPNSLFPSPTLKTYVVFIAIVFNAVETCNHSLCCPKGQPLATCDYLN